MKQEEFQILIKVLREIGLGNSTNYEGYGALEMLGMKICDKLQAIVDQQEETVKSIDTLADRLFDIGKTLNDNM